MAKIVRPLSINLIKRIIMKTLKMFVLAVAITFSTVLSASTNPIEKAEPASISETVEKLLKNPNVQLEKAVDAIVEIYINQKHEIVVLSVDTEHRAVAKFICSRLNYKKVDDTFEPRRTFRVPVRMLKAL